DFHVTGVQTCALPIFPAGRTLIGGVLALSKQDGLLAPQFREHGVPIHCLPVSRNPLRFVLDLARLLRQTGPWDVVHSHVYRRSEIGRASCRERVEVSP